MFGISGTELFLILLFGFLIFGPDKLPEIAKTVGRGIAKFKAAQQDMNDTLQGQIFDPNSDEPFKDPVQALDKLAQQAEQKDVKKSSATAAASAPATQARATGAGNAVRQESFTERKARYERERAAKRAEEEKRAKEAAAAPASAQAKAASANAAASNPTASTERGE